MIARKGMLVFVSAFVLLAGCSSSSEVPVRYYLLEPVIPSNDSLGSSLSVQIINLDLSQYLARFQIASRRPDNQLVFASNHQWAEALRKNITRALARNLTNSLGTPDIGTPNNRSASKPDFRLSIFVEQFERGPDGYVLLVARWQIIDPNGEVIVTELSSLESDARVTSTDFAGTVSRMSELLGDLSTKIATAIEAEA